MTARDAHIHAMEQARATHCLRTVYGYQYPVPEGEMRRFLQEQRERQQAKVRAFLEKVGPRAAAEAAFA